jgi:hypothetical protein
MKKDPSAHTRTRALGSEAVLTGALNRPTHPRMPNSAIGSVEPDAVRSFLGRLERIRRGSRLLHASPRSSPGPCTLTPNPPAGPGLFFYAVSGEAQFVVARPVLDRRPNGWPEAAASGSRFVRRPPRLHYGRLHVVSSSGQVLPPRLVVH